MLNGLTEGQIRYRKYKKSYEFYRKKNRKYINKKQKETWRKNSYKTSCIDCGKPVAKKETLYCKSCAKKSSRNPMFRKKSSRAGEKLIKNPNYRVIHKRIQNKLGQPNYCQLCGTKNAIRYEWANIDEKYSENPDDYIRVCRKCHFKFDNIGERISLGLKGKSISIKHLFTPEGSWCSGK